MGHSKITGLTKLRNIWQIDKHVRGYGRLCESTGTSKRREAESILLSRLEEIQRQLSGSKRQHHTWRDAATRFLTTTRKKSLARDAQALAKLDPFIGDMMLDRVYMENLQPYIAAQYANGIKSSTINREFAVVRRILNLAARLWRDENGMSWLETAPMIVMESRDDRKKPYPLSWDEQKAFIDFLPAHLQRMTLFKVNTGTRQGEVCALRWDYEVPLPDLGTSVFIIPGNIVKNTEDRLIVLNKIAQSVIEERRGEHDAFVFTYKGNPVQKLYGHAWRKAWTKAGLDYEGFVKGPHNLKHTFGRRLRAAGVSSETRKVLLGHKNGDITTHYSAVEIHELIDAANKVVNNSRQSPDIMILKLRGKRKTA